MAQNKLGVVLVHSSVVGSFWPGSFRPTLWLSRFGPIGTVRFGPIPKVGCFGLILGVGCFGLIYFGKACKTLGYVHLILL